MTSSTAFSVNEPLLTEKQRETGRRRYYFYSFVNAVSWATLAEGVVILLMLRLGASESWVGLVSSLQYVTLPLMVLGYRTVSRLGVTGTAALFWTIRSSGALFMILAPWVSPAFPDLALVLMFLGALTFMVGRAGGIVAFTGIFTELTTARSRGELISKGMRYSQMAMLATSLLMAAYLGKTAPLFRYQAFLTLGLIFGLIGADALRRIPEAGQFRTISRFDLRRELRWITATPQRRWFLAMMVAVPVTQGITYAFAVMLAKQGFGRTDQQVVLLVTLAMIGGVVASQTYSVFLDQLGSRPLLFLTGLMDMLGVLLVVVMPARFDDAVLGAIFFINGYALIAFYASSQHYFISLCDRQHQLAQGIVTRGIGGVAGGAALVLAGWILQQLRVTAQAGGGDTLLHFRWFYAGMLVLLTLRGVVFFKLPSLHSQGIRNALNALFSPWDWRAANAVRKALNSQREDAEGQALTRMMRSRSRIYREDLERYLSSPSIFIRRRALNGLYYMPPGPDLVTLLIKEMQVNTYTTAHQAAEVLGHWHIREAVPHLAAALKSPDFLLCGKAIHALVELDARRVLPQVEACFAASRNPYVLIEAGRALSLWGGRRHYAMLLDKYTLNIPPQTVDELSLAVARLMGLYNTFYKSLAMLHREPHQLSREWRDGLADPADEPLIAALEKGYTPTDLLLAALTRQRPLLYNQFFKTTRRFLHRQAAGMKPEAAFLLVFLLLQRQGGHRRKSLPVETRGEP